MKTFLATLIALGLVSGVASASTHLDVGIDKTQIAEWCGGSYYGH